MPEPLDEGIAKRVLDRALRVAEQCAAFSMVFSFPAVATVKRWPRILRATVAALGFAVRHGRG